MDQTEDCFHLGVKALLCNPSGQMLLLAREHPTKGFYWDTPGGRLQRGESLLQTLQRELEEETGLKTIDGVTALTTIVTDIRIPSAGKDVGLILSIYRLEVDSAFTPRLSEEHTHFGWFTHLEAVELLKKHYPVEFLKTIS